MIRLVTSRRLNVLKADRDQASEAACAAELDRDQHSRAEEKLHQELAQIQAVHDRTHIAWAAAEAAVISLRGEVAELVEELKTAHATPTTVYLLFRDGEPHSVHTDRDAAKARAAQDGASTEGWRTTPGSTPVATTPWCIVPSCVLRGEGER